MKRLIVALLVAGVGTLHASPTRASSDCGTCGGSTAPLICDIDWVFADVGINPYTGKPYHEWISWTDCEYGTT